MLEYEFWMGNFQNSKKHEKNVLAISFEIARKAETNARIASNVAEISKKTQKGQFAELSSRSWNYYRMVNLVEKKAQIRFKKKPKQRKLLKLKENIWDIKIQNQQKRNYSSTTKFISVTREKRPSLQLKRREKKAKIN